MVNFASSRWLSLAATLLSTVLIASARAQSEPRLLNPLGSHEAPDDSASEGNQRPKMKFSPARDLTETSPSRIVFASGNQPIEAASRPAYLDDAPATPARRAQPAVPSANALVAPQTFPFTAPQGPVIVYLPPGALPSSVQAWPGGWQSYVPAVQDQGWPIASRNAEAAKRQGALLPWPQDVVARSVQAASAPPNGNNPAARLTNSPGLFGSGRQPSAAPMGNYANGMIAAGQPTLTVPAGPNNAQLAAPGTSTTAPTAQADGTSPMTVARTSLFGAPHPVTPEEAVKAAPTIDMSRLRKFARSIASGGVDRPTNSNAKGLISQRSESTTTLPATALMPAPAAPAVAQALPMAPAQGSKGLFPRPAWLAPAATAVPIATAQAAVSGASGGLAQTAVPAASATRLPPTAVNTVVNSAAYTTNVQQASATAAPQNLTQQPATPRPFEPIAVPVAGTFNPDAAQPAPISMAPQDTTAPSDTASGSLAVKGASTSSKNEPSDTSSLKGRRNPIRSSADAVSTTPHNPLR